MEKSNSRKTKITVIVAICIALALTAGTIAIFAHLSGKSGSLTNNLEADVDPQPTINETLIPPDGPGYPVKKDVSVFVGDNDYTVYVRAAIVVTWVKEEHSEDPNDDTVTVLVHPEAPKLGVDYTLDLNLATGDLAAEQWRRGSDGFYYYTSPVEGGANTGILINSASQIWNGQAPYPVRDDGYVLRVEIAAQTIQAIGTTDEASYEAGTLAVVDAWGVSTKVDESTDPAVVLIYKGYGSSFGVDTAEPIVTGGLPDDET